MIMKPIGLLLGLVIFILSTYWGLTLGYQWCSSQTCRPTYFEGNKEVQRFFPDFPNEPALTKVFRWDRAVNMETPGQFPAIQDLLKNHTRDVKGLYLAGEYLFLIASTEGALATGKKAAEMVIEDLKNSKEDKELQLIES